MGPGEEAAGEQRTILQYTLRATWKQTPLTVTIALTVAVVAVVVAMAGTTIAEAVVGAAAGAAAGVGILLSLWEAEVRTGAVAVTAVAGSLTGTTAAILRSLVGAQSLTASAVSGAIAGAAIVAIARTQLQWVVSKIQRVLNNLQWVLALVKRVKAAVQWCRKVLPTATLIAGSGSAAIAAASQAETTALSGVSQAESAASGALHAESAASHTESAASGGTSQAESAASQAKSAASEVASQAESVASEEASQAESAAESASSQAESAAKEGTSKAESAASGGTSQADSEAESAASQAESAATEETSQAESAASEGASQTESAASQAESSASEGASQAESAASGGTSQTESAASQAESAATQAESAASEGASQTDSAAESAASEGASQADSAASQAESAASEGASQGESAAESVALHAESAASHTESAASGGTSQAESAASQAKSAASEVASQAESVASEEASQAESAAESASSQAESAATEGTSKAESAALGGTSQADSAAESAASQAESAATEETSQAESAASEGASQSESAASQAESSASEGASQAESAASGGTSQTESAASQAESAATQAESAASEGASQTDSAAESAASEGTSQADSAASQAESAASEGASQGESAAESVASQVESAAPGGTSQAESAAPGGTSKADSAASEAESAATGGASQAESAASGGASQASSQAESAAKGGASRPESAASQAESAASGGASHTESAASLGASLGVSATSGGASLGVSGASGGASLGASAASGGASLAASAASGGASLGVSAASGVASLGVSAASLGVSTASLGVSAASGGASLGVSAALAISGGASLAVSAISGGASLAASAASAGATGLSQGLLGGLGIVAGAKSAIFGSHRHRQLQTEAAGMLAAHTIIHESSQRDKSPQTDRSWTENTIEKEQPLLMPDSSENTENCVTGSKIPEQMTEDSISNDSIKGENKDIGTTGIRPDQHLQQEKIGREKLKHLFRKLHLEGTCHNKLRAAGVLQITEHSLQSHESCAEGELILNFLQKVCMMDYRARYIYVDKASQQDHTQQRHTDLSEDCGDIFKAVSLSNKGTSQSERIHSMDVQMAAFHCADGFLKQLMVTKLSQCQYALPLIVPDPFTQQIEFPLWTFRQINKSWKMRNTNNEIISQTQPIYKAQTPMVFFFRFGSVSSSKSQLMNSLINEKHNTFFHRNCPGSSRTRVLMDGVVEIAWFCPSGSYDDKFTDCVAFCNLHGDAGDHEKQLRILTEMASVNVVLLTQLDRNDRCATIIQNLYTNRKPLVCLFTEDESTVIEMKKGMFKIGLKDRNQSDVSEELRRAMNDCLSESSLTFRLEDVSKHSDIRVDEEDDDDCRRGREAAQQMMRLLEKKDLTEIKDSFLPHQGKLWHQWSQKNKELHRPRADEKEIDISKKQTEMMNIRQQQCEFKISEFMKIFIKKMNSYAENEKMFFLKWLRILLDEYISADLSALYQKYDETWSTAVKLNKKHGKSEQLKAENTDFERISEDLQTAAFGLEHIMREIGQIYESCSSVEKNKKDLQVHFSSLPSLAAEMMISGFPLELMDGDAAHVPVIWISAVLDQLIQKLGDQRVFVLSVLGTQSSGKSTMLNAMFGLQFAVSAGRCTRGAFMQLIRVSDEMKTQMNFDYILVVETEGLRALELAGRSTRHHDNELATFVVSLGNLTLINIFGENLSEMQDTLQIVVQAFMRMKKVRLNPSCVFVHQNVSDFTAGEKNMEGRRRLQKTLDEVTKLAAKEEECDAECFSDLIRFDVQNDVKYFAQLWEGRPPMAPPNPKYCENIQELKKSILSHAAKLHGTRLAHLKVCIKDLWEALLNERFVFKFRTALEISAYRKLETEYSKWSWSLRSAMLETENKLHNKIENETIHEVEETDLQTELKKTSEEVNKSMSEFFEEDKDKDILIQWKTSFEIKIKELQENIIRKTKSKLNEILQQQDLKKKIAAQRTHHENTLYETSRDLALKLKTKTNDEERLKKKFDLIWKQSVKKIIKDTPAIKDIDIMRDVREILSYIYGTPADHWKIRRDVFSVMSYYDYVKVKKSSGFFTKAKERFGYALSKEDDIQIKALVLDVVQQTDKMIQSFNISKMGYKISCIQQLTDYTKKSVTKHEEECVKYVFKKQLFIDLVYSICKRANEMITDQHRLFRSANDPVIYAEEKREEYYSIFQKYCHGTASAAIFGEIICQKLKEPIEQSVYKKTARDLANEMRSNCESLNGNRSKLEKHILETLAEEEDFDKYMNYIHNPRDHFKSFIRDEVSRYITDKFSVSVLPKMKENIELLQQKIMKAAHQSTEHVKMNRGDVGLWLKSFTQQLSDELIFSEKDISGVKHDDVDDFKLLQDVMRKELGAIMSEISRGFNTETFPVNLDYKFKSDEIVIDHFCQCCWVQCPFCEATCTNTIENHDGDHSVPFHRVTGIAGLFYRGTRDLAVKICTSAVANRNQNFYPSASESLLPCTEYRKAGGVYADWNITPDLSDLPYWKWFVCQFKKDLEKYYNKTFESSEIPDEWRKYSKEEAIESLNQYI